MNFTANRFPLLRKALRVQFGRDIDSTTTHFDIRFDSVARFSLQKRGPQLLVMGKDTDGSDRTVDLSDLPRLHDLYDEVRSFPGEGPVIPGLAFGCDTTDGGGPFVMTLCFGTRLAQIYEAYHRSTCWKYRWGPRLDTFIRGWRVTWGKHLGVQLIDPKTNLFQLST